MITALEQRLGSLSEGLPKLPAGAVAWLTRWAWLISLVVGILFALDAVQLARLATELGSSLAGIFFVSTHVTSELYLAAALTAVFAVLYIAATGPLKRGRYRGWRLIFVGTVLQLAFGIVIAIFVGVGGVLETLIEIAIGWYLLFQIRPNFAAQD
ncbi:hypothetical protein Afer_0484 [Acidimicrobium ferrooxidans DSM 10331]|uniref:Uncharacterized protein n=1 Tax=Acidimicrobium ferrooxidans (strain DSM 10331 / JCM 15462 / NBRC 103882 / ICP) TaxID=525909 RepID=C7M357_ACIFD|nr:hypothetical protein [Acidimicrobium ferrooxidans]ACU53451.1 hypothetical protein Afer_0484 [Acidimicrobium ferrooxidans DSM 10331]